MSDVDKQRRRGEVFQAGMGLAKAGVEGYQAYYKWKVYKDLISKGQTDLADFVIKSDLGISQMKDLFKNINEKEQPTLPQEIQGLPLQKATIEAGGVPKGVYESPEKQRQQSASIEAKKNRFKAALYSGQGEFGIMGSLKQTNDRKTLMEYGYSLGIDPLQHPDIMDDINRVYPDETTLLEIYESGGKPSPIQKINIKHKGAVPEEAKKKALKIMRENGLNPSRKDLDAAIKWIIDKNPDEFIDLIE